MFQPQSREDAGVLPKHRKALRPSVPPETRSVNKHVGGDRGGEIGVGAETQPVGS